MKCKLCKKETEKKVCQTCHDFLQWNYPDENIENILDKYKGGSK